MGSLNKVQLIGNLGRDAEMRYTAGGTAVANVNLATTERYRDRQEQWQEKTEWHRLVIWGKQAESLQEYLTKGKQIYAEGRLETRQWDDKDGNKRYTTEVRVDKIVLLGGERSGGGGGGQQRRRGAPEDDDQSQQHGGDEADDIPFAWLLPLVGALGWWANGASSVLG